MAKAKKVNISALEDLKQKYDVLEMSLWGLFAMADGCMLDQSHIEPILLYSQKVGGEFGKMIGDAAGNRHG